MKMSIEAKDRIQLIVKVSGQSCNMACTYCYERARAYDGDNPVSIKDLEMTLALLGRMPLSVQLHGGEPLVVGLDRMREILLCLRNYQGDINVNIQTNGLLLNEECLEMFDQVYPEIEVGISMDGDVYANGFRLDIGGKDVTFRVEHALELCAKRKRNIGIISVVNGKMIGRAEETLAYFRRFPQIKIINFTPCYDLKVVESKKKSDFVVSSEEYSHFVEDLLDCWMQGEYYKHFFIDPIFSIYCALIGRQSSLCHFHEHKCAHIFTLYPDGTLGSCDEVPQRYKRYGHISQISTFEQLMQQQSKSKLFSDIKEANVKCGDCAALPVCRQGCMSTRLNFMQSGQEDCYCRFRKELIDYVAENAQRTK